MFRELAYITLILSTATFGTEIIFRFKPENQTLGTDYIVQSNLVMASTITEIAASIIIVRYIERIPRFLMKILTLVILTPLIATIALRSKYNFFMPLDDKRFNVYNATSFFLCLSTITWATLWFFKSESPLTDPEIALSGTERTNRMRGQPQGRGERTPTGENTHRTSSLHRYDEEIDYTLPPYSEVPPPPTYTKVISPDGDIQIDQSEHVLTSAPEASLQSRSSVTTATQDACNANNEAVNEENASRVENSGGVNSDSLNPPPRSGRQ